MPTVGPQLPPHLLEKRKREADDENNTGSETDRSSSPDSTYKRQRTIGPTLPPAPLDERPTSSPILSHPTAPQELDDDNNAGSESNSDSDSDFGPALPTSTPSTKPKHCPAPSANPPAGPRQLPPSQRDEWMLVPPSSSDWTARIDPTKLKARKFNTTNKPHSSTSTTTSNRDEGKGQWNETPQEKQARLQREILGIKDPSCTNTASSSTTSKPSTNSKEDKETHARLEEYNASRGPSLYASHQKSQTKEEDDDPSARAFDREKDIGGGLQLNSTKRRDLMKKASDFGSRFGSAKYL